MEYKRLTAKDYLDTKYMELNPIDVLHRLWELEDKLEYGLAFDLTDVRFVGDSTYIAKNAYWGYPVLVIPISENEVKKLLDNGVQDYRDYILTE